MTFHNIYWIYIFLPVLVLMIIGYYYSQKKRRNFFQLFVSDKLQRELLANFSQERYFLKALILLFSLFFIFLTLARPQWGYVWKEEKAKGIDILFALDVSKSMLAQDVKPNRLERAKFAILDLTQKLEGDRLGLIAFAGTAFLQCPLTLDYNAFKESLEQMDPSVIYKGGTNIGAAIEAAKPVFAKDNNYKILILITDGEDLEKAGISAAELAAENEIRIYTVGVGTEEGELILIEDNNTSDYLRDRSGRVVKSKLDTVSLQKIASITGGFYVSLGPRGEGLEEIYRRVLLPIPKQDLSSNLKQVPLEQFQWPLSIALILLLMETVISTRRKQYFSNTNHLLKLFFILIFSFIFDSSSMQLSANIMDAYKAYENSQFDQATYIFDKELQKDPSDAVLNYNLGNSYYKDNKYSSAIKAFKNAIKTQDLELQQKAFYNLGNALFRAGEEASQTNSKKATEFWEDAIKSYQNAIELDDQDISIKENLEFVKKKLEELKKQQQNQSKQENNQNQNQEQEKEENQNKQNNSSSQNNSENQSRNNSQNEDKKDLGNKNGDSEEESKDKQNQDQEDGDNQENQEEDEGSKKESRNNRDSSGERKEQQKSLGRKMDKEEAENLLKTLENSEKKLPMTGEKRNAKGQDEEYNDW